MPEHIYRLIDAERDRQEAKWSGPHRFGSGPQGGPEGPGVLRATILMEEAGEVARAVLEGDRDGLERELVQVAAICVTWLLHLTGVASEHG